VTPFKHDQQGEHGNLCFPVGQRLIVMDRMGSDVSKLAHYFAQGMDFSGQCPAARQIPNQLLKLPSSGWATAFRKHCVKRPLQNLPAFRHAHIWITCHK
jgi:hypothetical protein